MLHKNSQLFLKIINLKTVWHRMTLQIVFGYLLFYTTTQFSQFPQEILNFFPTIEKCLFFLSLKQCWNSALTTGLFQALMLSFALSPEQLWIWRKLKKDCQVHIWDDSLRTGNLFLLFIFYVILFLGPHLRHMEFPRLEVRSELRLPAYTTATAMWNLSHACNTHSSL